MSRAAAATASLQARPPQPVVVNLRRPPSILGGAVRGAIAGGLATWLMDQVTTGLVESQSREDREREAAARPNGESSVGNLLDRIDAVTGRPLAGPGRDRAATLLHYALGVVPGAAYGVLRRRLPSLAAGGGLVYGLLLFVGNDEVLNTELGLAGPYAAYPLSSHIRGLVGHAVLGVATDTTLDLLGA